LPIYIALLRGINVAGKKVVKMESLRASFEALGVSWVRTYVQSGNVIFEAAKTFPRELSKIIMERISSDSGFSIPVVLKTEDEMKEIVRENPFVKEEEVDSSKLHVAFLSELPGEDAKERIDALNARPDQFRVRGREIYLYCPNGYGRSKLSNNALERALSVGATTRNWNTVSTLARISSE
jgi:uncharacterized protein (DUF1697 family)